MAQCEEKGEEEEEEEEKVGRQEEEDEAKHKTINTINNGPRPGRCLMLSARLDHIPSQALGPAF